MSPPREPPLTAGQYLLWVQHPQAALGANDFYVIKTRFGTENPPEINVDTNDTAAGAGVLTFAGDPGQVFTLSRLPGNDVDYYRFGLPAGLNFAVTCGGRVAGSGVRDLRVELRDESDTVVAMATETATGAASIPNMTLTSTNAYIRLSKGSQDPEVNGAWVRCGLRSSQ